MRAAQLRHRVVSELREDAVVQPLGLLQSHCRIVVWNLPGNRFDARVRPVEELVEEQPTQ